MKDKRKLYILGGVAIAFIILFIAIGLNENNWQYNISKRIPKVAALVVTGVSIAFSSVIFQTITNNRILTPSVLGLDSIYVFIQTTGVFIFGTTSAFIVNKNLNFGLSVILMLGGTMLLYKVLFKDKTNNLFFLLLVGTVMGTFFKSMSSFMQVLIDPSDFQVVQAKMFASFSNVNTDILMIAIIILLIIFAFIYDDIKKLDVMLLGRDHAINLGIDHHKLSKKILVIVAILVSVSTALVGPITFLGLLVVNLSYQLINTYKHSYIIVASSLISIIALVGGQFVVERVLNYNSTVSIIINFIGGVYFIYLLYKEGKR